MMIVMVVYSVNIYNSKLYARIQSKFTVPFKKVVH